MSYIEERYMYVPWLFQRYVGIFEVNCVLKCEDDVLRIGTSMSQCGIVTTLDKPEYCVNLIKASNSQLHFRSSSNAIVTADAHKNKTISLREKCNYTSLRNKKMATSHSFTTEQRNVASPSRLCHLKRSSRYDRNSSNQPIKRFSS